MIMVNFLGYKEWIVIKEKKYLFIFILGNVYFCEVVFKIWGKVFFDMDFLLVNIVCYMYI